MKRLWWVAAMGFSVSSLCSTAVGGAPGAMLVWPGRVVTAASVPAPLARVRAHAPAGAGDTGTWADTGNLITERYSAGAVRLPDGRVLVAGGDAPAMTLDDGPSSADLYDPASGTFSATSPMTDARLAIINSTVLLADGRVLIAGGASNQGEAAGSIGIVTGLSTAELYDSSSGTFSAAGSMAHKRAFGQAVRLPDGRVLIACGTTSDFNDLHAYPAVELFDPATEQWSAGVDVPYANSCNLATLTVMNNGKVLLAGGFNTNASGPQTVHSVGQLYDPQTGEFTPTGTMVTPRYQHTATLLSDGRVLLVGGIAADGTAIAGAELYDPATGTFTATAGAPLVPRFSASASALADGRVLIVGGENWTSPNFLASSELYDPATDSFASAPDLPYMTYYQSEIPLEDGRVLVAGGYDGEGHYLTSGKLYTPTAPDVIFRNGFDP